MRAVAVWIVMGLAFSLSGCERPSRSASYFVAHPDDRSLVLADCTSGKNRSGECDNAAKAAATARHQEAEDYFRASTGSK